MDQRRAFSRSGLNKIARNLQRTINSEEGHYNPGSGNYDANVLMVALRKKGKNVDWYDARRGVAGINLESGTLKGIVVHTVPPGEKGGKSGGHWSAVRRINGVWYDLDSYLDDEQPFGNSEEVREYLGSVLNNGGHLLLVNNNLLGNSRGSNSSGRLFVLIAVIS
ncbi:josephin-like protein [Senna tora]|uniref:ubiquitinyl hydrolase 1 n=1 Tax=Senna tora TaxID=362788 RepID=A0A834WW60_9FABA|nr:josephin-like protein [Senna tora]